MSAATAAVREHPILFSAEMVRALLDGRKTQTRRVVKKRRFDKDGIGDTGETGWCTTTPLEGWTPESIAREYACPYGAPGDRLWVRETWRPRTAVSPWDLDVEYAADGEMRTIEDGEFGERDWTIPKAASRGNVSPLFMPRWASRITLEITDVRVQRVQAIDDGDAIAEGIEPVVTMGAHRTFANYAPGLPSHLLAVDSFRTLWDSLNGPRGYGWDANPWVWALTFSPIEETR